jgi:dienelactone hydrolase
MADVKTTPIKPAATQPAATQPAAAEPAGDPEIWKRIEPFFHPPAEFKDVLGDYRSPLAFDSGAVVKTKDDWKRRRKEILDDWHKLMGPWPALLADPKVEIVKTEQRENFTQQKVTVQVDSQNTVNGYLLIPPGNGPFPAVLTVYYEPETAIGMSPQKTRDFGLQLVRRGFVTLNIGSPPGGARNPEVPDENWQPLSHLAYVAANCHTALAHMKEVDPKRIGIVGHSYGGKWAMMASCLYDKFACAVWCDPDVVFDEKKANANYWEPWYLGNDPKVKKRKPGIPSDANPRTGPYKTMLETHHDLTEIHALMAPRPVLVSGGAEDPPERWKALNYLVAVDKLLGYENRVALTARAGHTPTSEALDQVSDFFEYFLKPKQNP